MIDTSTPPALAIHSVSLHVVAVLTCECGRGPVVITGTSAIAACTCGARYMISSIRHQPRPDGSFDTNVEVGRLSDLALAPKSPAQLRRSH
jgi:hypothetical protein